ncbi:RNA-directed DNA polymerase [Bradyrhizobium sp. cf659]|uniref:RNA-directed DNA polymerase n=1 Tax=Bradyrhizobium sp. cf659 TaxID=1761771 RepID=UPI0008EF6C1A|nr:RNA-directed DNA polymerase [Bradyrhizobium sp. cf659]SFJ53663.1 Retron-type reverse transcriptase [Bradyrhizobium sp. cf659]
MVISLGEISFDEEIVLRKLKNDFRDDWFPDPIGFADFIEEGLLSQIITENFDRNHGAYVPSQALLLNIPKANFTLRYALETSMSDRTVYHALASYLLPVYDDILSWRVFSHRTSTSAANDDDARDSKRYTFRNGISAWNDFLGCVKSALKPQTVLLSTDLANYFENINVPKLKEVMLNLIPELKISGDEKAKVRAHVGHLFNYLSAWTFSKDKGLPQNRDASSFLANVYMCSVDRIMIEKGYDYFRYMDDIKIICGDIPSARRALKDLTLALRPIGQVVNSGKTHFVHSTDEEGLQKCLASGNVEMKRINAAWQSKSLKEISRSFVPLKELALSVLKSGGYDSREFRFCINRLETLARCSEFHVPAKYFEDLTPLVLAGLDDAPVATDQICKYLRAVDLSQADLQTLFNHLTDSSRSFYNWKNYLLWILLTQKGFKTVAALDYARLLVSEREDDPTRAGATIYLGALGDTSDRARIAEHFKNLNTFLGQRSAVIAVQELHFRPTAAGGPSIDTHVRPHLRTDLKGAYRALNRAGLYVSQLEPLSIARFVDLERDYDG